MSNLLTERRHLSQSAIEYFVSILYLLQRQLQNVFTVRIHFQDKLLFFANSTIFALILCTRGRAATGCTVMLLRGGGGQ
jgi:hypothetical protein